MSITKDIKKSKLKLINHIKTELKKYDCKIQNMVCLYNGTIVNDCFEIVDILNDVIIIDFTIHHHFIELDDLYFDKSIYDLNLKNCISVNKLMFIIDLYKKEVDKK